MNELILSELKFNAYTLKVNLDGISDGQSEVQPKTNVNSVKWILEHLVNTRMDLFKTIGIDSTKIGKTDGLKLVALYALFGETQDILIESLNEKDFLDSEKAMVITKYMLHESYHIGQIGYCRRFLGLAGALY